MKTKSLFFALFICCSPILFGQSPEYIPMIVSGSQWNELVENNSLPPKYRFQKTYVTKIANDTLINGVSYYKLLTAKDEFSSTWLDNGYIREDLENRKVYYIPQGKEKEILLYNFNVLEMKVGNKILSYDFHNKTNVLVSVLNVEYDYIGGKNRMIANIRSTALDVNCICEEDHIWIEGIGNMDGFLRSTISLFYDGSDMISLLCFFQNEELIYKPENTNIEDCFIFQTKDNKTIVNDNSSWSTLVYGASIIFNIPSLVKTEYVYFEGDSTIAELSYKKVFSCDDKLHKNIKYEGLIREQNKKTFFIPANSDVEYLLYDFSLELGTNFEYWHPRGKESELLYVKNIDSIEVNGSKRKRIQITLSPDSEWILDTWIEELGSLSGILYPCYPVFLPPGGVKSLLCYHKNNELIYINPDYSECYYDKPEDIKSIQTTETLNCSIFPNPVDNILNISCLNKTILRVEIFDNSGRKVYSQAYKDTINISSFSKGSYLLKIYDMNEQVSVYKLIKH